MLRLSPLLLLAALALTIPSARAITYADWIASYGLTGPSAEATADPDADGLPNLLEYALDGLAPNVANNSATSASLPVYGFARRTGDALGAWEWVAAGQRGTGLGGIWHAGFSNVVSSLASSGAYFYSSNGGNIFARTSNGGVSTGTDTDTGIAFTIGTQRKLEIRSNGTTITFYIDGVLVATHAANIPSAVVGCAYALVRSAATAYNASVDISYFGLRVIQPTDRYP